MGPELGFLSYRHRILFRGNRIVTIIFDTRLIGLLMWLNLSPPLSLQLLTHWDKLKIISSPNMPQGVHMRPLNVILAHLGLTEHVST